MTLGDVKLILGTAIRNQRNKLRISQEELAYRSGLHRTYISDVERGARNLSLESIDKLARALDLSLSALFSMAGYNSSGSQLLDILLVEDNPSDSELAVRAFKKAGIANRLRVVRDGAEALDLLLPALGSEAEGNGHPLPGVILLDLHLPKVSGMEVLRRIKADPRTEHIPVIVLTISSEDRDIAACRLLGVHNYIVKPVGFRNFCEVTPNFPFEWALKTRSENASP